MAFVRTSKAAAEREEIICSACSQQLGLDIMVLNISRKAQR